MKAARTLERPIVADLVERMVFLAGPRQIGKTTAAGHILAQHAAGAYFNWDNRDDRRDIRAARWPAGPALVVLDELHKWRGWKGWLKGEFDKHHDRLSFLVTGSARLDVYRRGGDSLQGRYRHYRLHPFSVAELAGRLPDATVVGGELPIATASEASEALGDLLEYSGFPEPFFAQSARAHRRWQRDRVDRFFREDVRELDAVRDLSAIEALADLMTERVGSPLSLNALREDLEVSHRAVTHWVDVLDHLYHLVRVRPYDARQVRALRQMPKVYLWDWSLVASPGARFENMVGMHLLKFVHTLRDVHGFDAALHYLRDRAGREVDFLVTLARKPWFAVEAKVSDLTITPALRYFGTRLQIPYLYQVVLEGTRDFVQDDVRCVPAAPFLAALA
jgi:uncharacterized protein